MSLTHTIAIGIVSYLCLIAMCMGVYAYYLVRCDEYRKQAERCGK